jgi:uncharacterized membrane protein YbhN (UPF0104 family)
VRAAEAAALVVVLGFAAAYLARHGGELRSHGWDADPGALAASGAAGGLALVVFGLLWVALLRQTVPETGVGEAFRVWSISNLARYVPGKIWQVSGLAWLARRSGIPAGRAVATSLVLQALTLVTGALLLAATLRGRLGEALGTGAEIALVAAAAAGLAVYLSPLFDVLEARAARLLGAAAAPPRLGIGRKLAFGAGTLAGWALYGASFWFLLDGIAGAGVGPVAASGIFLAGYLAVFLAVFTPGGLGVREAVTAVLLAPHLSGPVALTAALLSRVVLTVMELVVAGLSSLAGRRAPRARTSGRAAGTATGAGGAPGR